MTLRLLPVFALALSSLCACATVPPHTQLQEAPPSSAPYAVRAAYYKAHALGSADGQKLLLHDGTAVHWPEDLKPAVAKDSPTAKAIDRSVAARAELDAYAPAEQALGLTAAAGLGLLLFPLALPVAMTVVNGGSTVMPEWVWPTTFSLTGTGGVALTVSLLGGMLLPMFYSEARTQHTEAIQAIVQTYPQSLSDQVGIQPNADGQLMDTAKDAPKSAPEPGQNDV